MKLLPATNVGRLQIIALLVLMTLVCTGCESASEPANVTDEHNPEIDARKTGKQTITIRVKDMYEKLELF